MADIDDIDEELKCMFESAANDPETALEENTSEENAAKSANKEETCTDESTVLESKSSPQAEPVLEEMSETTEKCEDKKDEIDNQDEIKQDIEPESMIQDDKEETSVLIVDHKEEIIPETVEIAVPENAESIINDAVNEEKIIPDEKNTAEINKETEESQPNKELPSTSNIINEVCSKRKLSDTPEDIINLLKTLSPEKLLEIKSKVLEITDSRNAESALNESKKLKQNETTDVAEEKIPAEETPDETKTEDPPKNVSADVICLDSDDEDIAAEKETKEEQAEETAQIEDKSEEADNPEQKESETEEVNEAIHLNGDSHRLNLKECINPECLRNKDDEYLESPMFVLSMFYISRKSNKTQWVCSTCYEEAVTTYENLCSKFLSNEPWTSIKIPKKQDLVEIIDSDEEDNDDEGAKSENNENDEAEMIIFNEEIEKEVEEILTDLTSKIDIKMQFEEEYKLIDSKIDSNEKLLSDISNEITQLERKSYKMYDELYSYNRPKIQRRPSLSLDSELVPQIEFSKTVPTISDVSITPIVRPASAAQTPVQKAMTQPDVERICYGIRQRGVAMPHWMPCRIIEEMPSNQDGKRFKVQFVDNMPNSLTVISAKEISVALISEKLEIGARVIALFPRSAARSKQQQTTFPKRFLPGVIGEKLTQYNKRRYLVFCDYGQVRYCAPNEVRAIQDASENVWDDVHPNLRQFIRDYLESKTNRSRALLNVRVNTQILTERSGNWRKTIVQEVDCSLVKVYFTAEHVSEWLYRGSKRLYTMYQQTQRIQSNTFQRRTDPGAFSYITIDEDEIASLDSSGNEIKKNIAKKSTAKPQQLIQPQPAVIAAAAQPIILNDKHIYIEDPATVAKVRHFTPKAGICSKKFVKHECSKICIIASKNDLSAFSPLSKPLLSCWERQIVRQRNYRFVVYKAPCGRRLRSMNEVFIYLGMTKCILNVDNFDFDPSIQVLASYHVDKSVCPLYIDDITEGKDGMKVNCINAFDTQKPPPLEYSPNRIPMNGVNINTDPEFMSCCDCKDECVDKSKCSCFQLTIRGAKYKNLMEEDEENISYLWKRLLLVVPTGIYECNSRCKCSERCLNKVVQQPVRVKMQLYRTKARGWGLQSLHDIPKGTFICIYAGNLYAEKDANALCQGLDHGDEYFAELDLIENAENRKEGYESGIIYPDSDHAGSDSDSDYDDKNDSHDYEDGDFVSKSKATGQREILTRSSKTSLIEEKNKKKSSASSTPQRQNSEGSSDDDEMVSMIPNAANTGSLGSLPEGMRIPFRKLYGPKEKVYIMDAKQCGNVGRYFNHSCDPNLFVQSVFVDTHDLRFPWIAFFAQRPIKAGEELTWNYNYEVGSVPSKVLYCKCGSKNCRGRIL